MLWSASAPCLWLRAYVLCVSVLLCALGVVCLLCVLTLPRPVLGQLRSVAGSDPDALQEALSDISQSPDVDFIAAHMVGAVPLCMPSGLLLRMLDGLCPPCRVPPPRPSLCVLWQSPVTSTQTRCECPLLQATVVSVAVCSRRY